MAQYKVRHQCDRDCCDCKYFEDEEYWDGEAECRKGHNEHVGWGVTACDDFESETND